MPRRVAADEQAVELAAAADFGERAADDLEAYDRRENRAHRALLAICDDPEEQRIVRALVAGDVVERAKIRRSGFLAHLIGQNARRLAGFFTAASRG
jgi:hypothetical protein